MKTALTTHFGAAACAWLALASAPMASAGEPIILTPDRLDAVTAGSVGTGVDATAGAIGASGALTATSTTTSAISGTKVGQASGQGGALAVAQGDGSAGTSITNWAGADNGSSGAFIATNTSSGAAGDPATATSSSQTRAIATPVATIALSRGYASGSADTTNASTTTSGYGDILVSPTHNNTVTNPNGTTARTGGVVVAVSPPG